MKNLKITFFDNFPIEQREMIKSELSSLQVEYDETGRPLSNDFIIPTLILGISFVAKPFFEAFLSELGKDTYGWIKTKIGLSKANNKSSIKVTYKIIIGEARFYDDVLLFSESRHESVMNAVQHVFKKCPENLLPLVQTVILKYDVERQKYISASLYSTQGIRGGQVEGKLGTEPLNISLE